MIVKKIEWLLKDALEAKLTIQDDLFSIICFSQPYKEKNTEVKEPINVLNPVSIKRINIQSYSFTKQKDFFGYKIEGKLINKKKGLVRVGNFILEFDNHLLIPKDIINNEFVSFFCDRLDIY